MESKQDKTVTIRHSRPVTPATPPSNTIRPLSASSPQHQKAWVAAEWKHRVPEPGLPGPKPAPGSLNSRQRAQVVERHRHHVAAEYACVQDTISSILARCNQVQQHLGSSSSSSLPGTSKPHSPTYISRRSKILFEAPSDQQDLAGSMAQANCASSAGASSADSCHAGNPTAALQSTPADSWAGAVDLNPGFNFRPGTPQRLAATCRDELPMLLAHISRVVDDMKHSNVLQTASNSNDGSSHTSSKLSSGTGSHKVSSSNISSSGVNNLKHREVLQAGLQQLNGEFYNGTWAKAVQAKQGIIPASWSVK